MPSPGLGLGRDTRLKTHSRTPPQPGGRPPAARLPGGRCQEPALARACCRRHAPLCLDCDTLCGCGEHPPASAEMPEPGLWGRKCTFTDDF